MLYALLCYNHEDTVFSWTKEEDDAVMAQLHVVHDNLAKQGKLGPAIRLLPTTAATTLVNPDDAIAAAISSRSGATRLSLDWWRASRNLGGG